MERVQFGGDSPGARFGHTITPIGKDKAILFGGAVGDTGKYVITGDTFICDYNLKKWKKLEGHGVLPSNLDHFFFVFGGALGGGELADDGLYQLDFLTLSDKAYWTVKNCKGSSPGARYGHVMAYLKPYIIIFAGNTGSQPVGDIWKIDVFGNCIWEKVSTPGDSPPPRVYHSASICRTGTASGMMVIFGGRGGDGIPLNDTWGLRKHRDGRMDWMRAPYRSNSKPAERYQHRSLFVGTLLLIVGGRNNQVGESMPLDIYDTDSSDWYRLEPIDRFRHISFLFQDYIFIHGGFSQEAPNIPTDAILRIDLNKLFSSHHQLYKGLAFEQGKDVFTAAHGTSPKKRDSSIEEPRRGGTHQVGRPSKNLSSEVIPRRNIHTNSSIRLCPEAVVANFNEEHEIKRLHIDMLPSEHRRLVGNTSVGASKEHVEKIYKFFLGHLFLKSYAALPSPMSSDYVDKLLDYVEKILNDEQLLVKIRAPVKIFGDIHGQINELNRFFDNFGAPADDGDIEYNNYIFLGDYVDRGTRSVETILLLFALKLKYPENIYLLRGSHEDKQINRAMGFGDECAQKFKENIDDPRSFFSRVNRIFQKLPLAALVDDNIFCCHGGIGHTMRSVFELEQMSKPIRVTLQPRTKQEKITYELLWTDPCQRGEPEYTPNLEHDYLRNKTNAKFSEERAVSFCNQNDLMAIVRSHEPYMEGFSGRDSVITVFSCSDYGGNGNKASILQVSKDGDLRPKILNMGPSKDRWMNLEDAVGRKSALSEDNKLRAIGFTPPKK